MGLRPTPGDENQIRRPREGGDPFPVDSRLRGNDVQGAIFWRAAGDGCGVGAVREPPLRCCVRRGSIRAHRDASSLYAQRFKLFERGIRLACQIAAKST